MAGFSIKAVEHAKGLLAEVSHEEAVELLRVLGDGRLGKTEPGGVAGPSDRLPAKKGRKPWTEAQKAAAAVRMKARWASGAMKGKVGRKKSKRGGSESHG